MVVSIRSPEMQLPRVGNGQTAGGKVMQTAPFCCPCGLCSDVAFPERVWYSGKWLSGGEQTDLGMVPLLAFLLSRGLWTVGIFLV